MSSPKAEQQQHKLKRSSTSSLGRAPPPSLLRLGRIEAPPCPKDQGRIPHTARSLTFQELFLFTDLDRFGSQI